MSDTTDASSVIQQATERAKNRKGRVRGRRASPEALAELNDLFAGDTDLRRDRLIEYLSLIHI